MHAERSVIESRTPRRFIVTDDGRAPESESTASLTSALIVESVPAGRHRAATRAGRLRS